MTYSAEISRTNPTCFIFLLDQSGSMQDPVGGGESTKKKADGVSDAINRLLQNLVIKCARDTGVYDYFHIGIVGYGATVGPAWGGQLTGRELVPISEIGNSPARIEERSKKVDDGAGGILDQTVKFPIWFDPIANGGTPMCRALEYAKSMLSRWVSDHPDGYPPIVIHITDGESTDGDPSSVSSSIKALSTSDGNCLLINLHLSSTNSSPISFPDSEGNLPDQYAKLLFNLSSTMTAGMRSHAVSAGLSVNEFSRGYVFNGDLVLLAQFLDIGTRPSNLR